MCKPRTLDVHDLCLYDLMRLTYFLRILTLAKDEPKFEQASIMQKSANRRKPCNFSFDSSQPQGQSSAP